MGESGHPRLLCLQSKWPLPRAPSALLSQWTQRKDMEMIEKRQNKADCWGVCRCQITLYDKTIGSPSGILIAAET